MRKRVWIALALLVLAIIVFITFWKFDLGKRLVDNLIILSEWEMPQVSYSMLFLIGAVAVLVAIIIVWIVLHFIPKRRAAAVAETNASIKPDEQFKIENEARKTLSQIIGGIVLIIGLLFTGVNLAVTQREAERSRSLDQEGQITDRFTKAIKQLDSKNAIELRLGGIYALERIARDSERDHWTIMEILTAYVREHASVEKPGNFMKSSPVKRARNTKQEENPKLPTDIQAVLTVIGRRNIPEMGETGRLDLAGTILRRANLRGADLYRADLYKADLSEATLLDVNLFDADLNGADLSRAFLVDVNLSGADLSGADLSGAILSGAKLGGAKLGGANLSGANLYGANLGGAYFGEADLIWGYFGRTNLGGADLSEAHNLTWQNVSQSIVDDETKLPIEMEIQHIDELRVMREQTKRARADRKLTGER